MLPLCFSYTELLKEDIKGLPTEEKDRLLYRLTAESETIRNSFATLVTHTQMYLQHSDITAKEFVIWLKENQMIMLASQIESTDTIHDILNKVRDGKYWSFFNYELLANMITCFCKGTSLIKELDDYISEFKVYCQRGVSEVPYQSLTGGDQDTSSIFKVKMDDNFRIPVLNLKKMQYKLEVILHKKPIHLVDIESGCIKLTFRYFDNNKLFPLREAEKVALAEMGVQWLSYGEDTILMKTAYKSLSQELPSTGHTPPQQPSSGAPATTGHTPPQQPPTEAPATTGHTPPQQPPSVAPATTGHTPPQQPPSVAPATIGHTPPQQPPSGAPATTDPQQPFSGETTSGNTHFQQLPPVTIGHIHPQQPLSEAPVTFGLTPRQHVRSLSDAVATTDSTSPKEILSAITSYIHSSKMEELIEACNAEKVSLY